MEASFPRIRLAWMLVLPLAGLVAACGQAAREKTQSLQVAPVPSQEAGPDKSLPPIAERHNLRTFLHGGTPPDLPSYLPLYPDAKVVGGFERPSRFGTGGSVIFTTASSPGDVIAYYEKITTTANFVQSTSNANGGTLTYGARAGERSIQVIAQPLPGGSHVQLFWTGAR